MTMETELLQYQLVGQTNTPTFTQQQLKDNLLG